MRVLLVFLFVLGAGWTCDARELETTKLSTTETEISDVLVGRNENVCTLCEEFAADALKFFADNKTQTEIMDTLHKSCSKLLSFKQECISLVDYYAPLFFLQISSVQPGDFCQKVNLCEQIATISRDLHKDSCGLCHHAVAEALLKLKDPDTQLEIIELLLKACDSVENYVKKCKKMVFEYGPLILVNAEQFLETNDICTIVHACHSPTANIKQAIHGEISMISKY